MPVWMRPSPVQRNLVSIRQRSLSAEQTGRNDYLQFVSRFRWCFTVQFSQSAKIPSESRISQPE
jgi:hypothetical protein